VEGGATVAFLRRILSKLFKRKPKRQDDASIYPMF
jgi:hypothetical protein